jgi:alpha-2-macroglobulin
MSSMTSLGQRLRRILRASFGEVSWTPPPWLAAAGAAVGRGAAGARANRRRALAIAAGVLALVAGGVLLWRWYEARPKPVLVAFEVAAPAVTCYGCDPPGSPNPLLVRFDASAAPLEGVGHAFEADDGGIRVRPELAGEWRWDDDRTLRFQPKDDWPIGTKYVVDLDRRRFAAPQVRLAEHSFEFVAPAFTATIAATEFHQDPVVAGDKKVVATVTFSHPVDPASFEQRVRLSMFDRVTDTQEKELAPPAFTVVYDKLKLNGYVHSAELEVPPKSGRLQLSVDAGVRPARGGNATPEPLRSSVEIPGLNSLKVTNLALDIARDERNEPQQVLLVGASFSVAEQELPPKVSAWLLPLRHPDPKLQGQFEKRRPGAPFAWTEANFRPEVLTDEARVTLTHVPGERDHYEDHGFRYTADPGRQLYVRVQAGLRSFGGYRLGEPVERIVSVPEFPRELSILGRGSLLSLSGEKTISLFARNVPAMRIEVGRLLPRQLQHLVTQTGGSFDVPNFSNYQFDSANITERLVKIVRLPRAAPGEAQYEALDLGEYLDAPSGDRRGVFLLRVNAWDPDTDRPLGRLADQWNQSRNDGLGDARLVVVTDLGLVVKRAVDGAQDIFVQSIADGMPVVGATVDIIGRNGLPVLTETTDADGHVRFPDLESFRQERAPVLYLARRGEDSSFIPVTTSWDARGRALDLSRFDIGGVDSSADRGALSAYLFSDRGIYRPGEEIRAAAIVRSQDWSRKLGGVPLRLEITDPRGVVIRRETFVPGAAGFGEIRQPTRETSPTGTYTLAISVVRGEYASDLVGSTTVQVRDFQPDRLRMSTRFSAASADGWVSPEDLAVNVSLENLFGTPAENRRITAQMSLNPSFPSFRAYPDYRFHDPQYAKEGFNERLADATTDAAGQATLPLNLQRFARATYRVHLVVQGFEADGGRGVTTETAQLVSSMKYLVGYKPDGDLDYLRRGTTRKVDLVAIDPHAKRVAVDKLRLARLDVRYVSVLMRQPNGIYKYESRRKETTLAESAFAIAAGGHTLTLPSDTPGSFAYVVRDPEGQQLARIDYQVAGDANVTRTLEKNAELELVLAKKDVAPGEDVEVSIRAPYAGAGLITIERERVYAWRWFSTTTTGSVQRIRLPDGLEGNAYVSVTFVRDPASSEVYTSPLSYGVQPFSIDVDARKNEVTIDAPARARPGEKLRIGYRTARPARILLFAVDEGILQVAGYAAPDPLAYFFQKRALQVSTTQILDLVLPEFRHLGLASAPGGDAEGALGKHLNPFRRKGEAPVAYWSGILDADPRLRHVEYTVPDYFNGTLRILAVAVADERVGVFDGRSLVRGDFVLSPNAPTTVTPGDEFDVSVGIANNVEGSGADAGVVVSLETDRGLEVVGSARQQLAIAEGREGSTRFRLRAHDALGPADLRFAASTAVGAAARGSARRTIDLSVRPVSPYMTELTAGVLAQGTRDVPIRRVLYPQHRELEAGISALPLQFAHGFARYLAAYPYACTEQIVSQAMPAVLLAARPDFGYVRTEPGADLGALVGELRSRQNDAGAYRLWPGGDQVAEFVSLYAQHLLVEAAERGQPVPWDLVANGNNYLRSVATRDGNNLAEERQSAYAIYLLSRQGQRMAAEAATARKRLETRYRDQWRQDLAAAWLAAALELMQQERDARQLIAGVPFGRGATGELYDDAMTRDALLLFILARHFPDRLRTLPPAVMDSIATSVSDDSYHSLSAGTTLLALDAYATASESVPHRFTVAEVLKDKRVRTLSLPEALFPRVAFSDQASGLRFGNDGQLRAYFLVEQSGFDRKPPAEAIRNGLEVIRDYTDETGRPVTEVAMGQQVDVRLRFRGLKADRIGGVALVDLLPGGFDLVVPIQAPETPFAEAPGEAADGEDAPEGEMAGGAAAFTGWRCSICVGEQRPMLEYADLREDRVVFHVTASPDAQEIVYRIKATNVGTFNVPPAYGEAMYDRGVQARSGAGRLTVTRP